MPEVPPPRLYALVATKAPVALVFRRGSSDWWHLLRWNLDDGSLEPGVWVRKKLYPRRCDLSADGSLLCFYLGGPVPDEHGTRWYAVLGGISRAPWIYPLRSWKEGDTWGRGWSIAAAPQVGDEDSDNRLTIAGREFWIRRNDAVAFLNERRRGWVEASDCPTRAPDDIWDEKRGVILEKPCPTGGRSLRLHGGLWVSRGGVEGRDPRFEIVGPAGHLLSLPQAAWADWGHDGRLLVATRDGRLIMYEVVGAALVAVIEHDLSAMKPDPRPAPQWASAGAAPKWALPEMEGPP